MESMLSRQLGAEGPDTVSPRVARKKDHGGRRPPPRAGATARKSSTIKSDHGIQRAIMTIGEDQVVSYIDEDATKIEEMLREKHKVAEEPDVSGVTDGMANVGISTSGADGVDPSLVASALENLLGSLHSLGNNDTAPKCDDEDSFYSSISGNDALAAGMFDISVVCAELGADSAPVPEEPRTDSGVESIEPSPSVSSQSEGSVDAPAAVPPHAKSKRVDIVRETIFDQYRPRTSSKAPDPDLGSAAVNSLSRSAADAAGYTCSVKHDSSHRPHHTSFDRAPGTASMETDDTYRPRTSSRAPEPDADLTSRQTD
eukprot:m.80252 g.80252  ORF g.80252 m.80252 type:complete len:314 (-) comp19363_c0_seq1:293-1234(-)